MIVIKPGHTRLDFADLKSNYLRLKFNEDGNVNFTITYSVYDRHKPKESQKIFALGYYEDNSIEKLKEYIEWINKENYTAIIHLSHDDIICKSLPIFFKDNEFCLLFEGFKDQEFEETLNNFTSLSKQFKDISSIQLEWLIQQVMDQKDVVVTLNNESKFNFLKTWASYDDNGIIYCQYGRPYKNYIYNSSLPPLPFIGYHS